MAWDAPEGMITIDGTTGLTQYRFIVGGSAGATYPAAGAPIDGVIYSSGTTGSTETPRPIAIATRGIVKVSAPASTLSAGDLCTASSIGQAANTTAGDYVVGRVVDGSSGGAGRILAVLLNPIGTT